MNEVLNPPLNNMTNDKYINELETKLQSYQEKETNWKKEQSASITIFKDKEKEIKNLNSTLNNTEQELSKSKENIKEITNKQKETLKEIKDLKATIQSKEQAITNYANETTSTRKRNDLLNQELNKSKERVKELVIEKTKLEQWIEIAKPQLDTYYKNQRELEGQLKGEQEKNKLLEEKIKEYQEKDKDIIPTYSNQKWETEKENLIKQFEKTRNEQGKEIEELEEENKQLDKDLNKAVDELEERDEEIEELKKSIRDLQQENQKQYKTIEEVKNQGENKENIKLENPELSNSTSQKYYLFTCDICEQNKKSHLHLGKVNGLGIDPLKENKICDYCINKVDIIKDTEQEYIWE